MPYSQNYSDDFAEQLKANHTFADITSLRELSNGTGADLDAGEVAIDTNRAGTGATALVYKTQDGATTGYVDLTAGY